MRMIQGEYNFAGQYMQSPAPLGGGMVKAEWFRSYPIDLPVQFETVVQSWDTANKPTELSDHSVCTTWGAKEKHFYLRNVFRKRLGYPELKRAVREQAEAFDAKTILIEDRSGTQLIQELTEEGLHGVQRYDPKMDKVMRMHSVTSTIENGFVHLPEKAHWLDEYVHELTSFPKGKYDDQVDSTSQALDWLKRGQQGFWFLDHLKELREAQLRRDGFYTSVCPKCGNSELTRYPDGWLCPCGAAGTNEKAGELLRCPTCDGTSIARVGRQWRCQKCGVHWSKV